MSRKPCSWKHGSNCLCFQSRHSTTLWIQTEVNQQPFCNIFLIYGSSFNFLTQNIYKIGLSIWDHLFGSCLPQQICMQAVLLMVVLSQKRLTICFCLILHFTGLVFHHQPINKNNFFFKNIKFVMHLAYLSLALFLYKFVLHVFEVMV